MSEATMETKVREVVARQLGVEKYFLKIDGIKGESQDKNHVGELELVSYGWGVEAATVTTGGAGQRIGRSTFQDFQFGAKASKAGPQLMLHCATGTRIKQVVLTGARATDAAARDYLKITLSDVVVTSYASSVSGGDGAAPMDTASVRFGKIDVEYRETRPDGQPGETVKTGYDLAKAVRG